MGRGRAGWCFLLLRSGMWVFFSRHCRPAVGLHICPFQRQNRYLPHRRLWVGIYPPEGQGRKP
jgi:hypothetical protein